MRVRLAALWILILALALFSFSLAAQTPDPEPTRPGAPVPVITFDLNFVGANPAHYAISVESTGRASYRSDNPGQAPASESSTVADAAASQPYTTEFIMSAPTRRQLFDLARQANYFQGDFEYHKGRVASTGVKTLTYSEGPQTASFANFTNGKHFQTTYNYSQNPVIQQVTDIFQRISTTLEFGKRLQREHRFDRMSLEGELKRMEDMHKSRELLEVQAIAPVLRDIANDSAVFNITRQRAIRLLKAGGAELASK
jgi:hypothetical protein